MPRSSVLGATALLMLLAASPAGVWGVTPAPTPGCTKTDWVDNWAYISTGHTLVRARRKLLDEEEDELEDDEEEGFFGTLRRFLKGKHKKKNHKPKMQTVPVAEVGFLNMKSTNTWTNEFWTNTGKGAVKLSAMGNFTLDTVECKATFTVAGSKLLLVAYLSKDKSTIQGAGYNDPSAMWSFQGTRGATSCTVGNIPQQYQYASTQKLKGKDVAYAGQDVANNGKYTATGVISSIGPFMYTGNLTVTSTCWFTRTAAPEYGTYYGVIDTNKRIYYMNGGMGTDTGVAVPS
jgi:hypothetical protein